MKNYNKIASFNNTDVEQCYYEQFHLWYDNYVICCYITTFDQKMLLYKHQLYNEHCNSAMEEFRKGKDAFQQNEKDEKLRTELKEMERDDNNQEKIFNTNCRKYLTNMLHLLNWNLRALLPWNNVTVLLGNLITISFWHWMTFLYLLNSA